MTSDFFATRERLRAKYIAAPSAKGEPLGESGFLTEIAGRIILTAPAHTFSAADELPKELAARWQETADGGNEHYLWLQGRYVEAEAANRNGAFWSTEDLQFGEMSVKHGPLNWLHDEKTVIGTIADNALVRPGAAQLAQLADWHQSLTQMDGVTFNAPADTYTVTSETFNQLTPQMLTTTSYTTNIANVMDQVMPRPYMAAISAAWKWVHPEKVAVVATASEVGKLWYSMECIGREISCVTDGDREGCGKSFDYVTAMCAPEKTCEHIAGRTSARRIVDPSFLGGAVIIPPTRPGWGDANLEVMRQAAGLAEQTYSESSGLTDAGWTELMTQVMAFATS